MKIITYLTLFISLLALVFCAWIYYNKTQLGYVRTAILFEKYEGAKEARIDYEQKMGMWQSNIDTLQIDLKRSIDKFNQEYSKLGKEEISLRQDLLQRQQKELANYIQNLESRSKKEDEIMVQGVLNQINSFIQEYAQKNDYDFIFGTTIGGNIMYSGEAYDLTEEVLFEMNEEYKNGR